MEINWIWIVGLIAPLGAPALLRVTILLIQQWKERREPELGVACQDDVARLAGRLREFMPRVLDLQLEDCIITDLSSLGDFDHIRATSESLRRIEELYGIREADLTDDRLVTICDEIERRGAPFSTPVPPR